MELDDWKAYIAEATKAERQAGERVIDAIIERGRRIAEFHAAYKAEGQRWGQHWEEVCQKTIGISRDMCYRYMVIGKNNLYAPHNILPVSVEALFHLSRIAAADQKVFDDAVATGEIHPKMGFKDAKALADRIERKPGSTGRPRNGEKKAPKPEKPGRNRLTLERLAAGPHRHLTPAEVDPEFTGSAIDWTDKYGHVQVETAEQRATGRFTAWALNVRLLASEAKKLPDWPEVDHNWLRSPKPHAVAKLAEALEYLRPKLAEAEALLARAMESKNDEQETRPVDAAAEADLGSAAAQAC
jgi:hypothetical protein